MSKPKINWIKNDLEKYRFFTNRSIFMVALQVRDQSRPNDPDWSKDKWEFAIVEFDCDGDGCSLNYQNGDVYDSWNWEDIEYFALMEGDMPTAEKTSEEDEWST